MSFPSAIGDACLTVCLADGVYMAAVVVAACGIALGFLTRITTDRTPYRHHSRPVAASIRWEKNWHR